MKRTFSIVVVAVVELRSVGVQVKLSFCLFGKTNGARRGKIEEIASKRIA